MGTGSVGNLLGDKVWLISGPLFHKLLAGRVSPSSITKVLVFAVLLIRGSVQVVAIVKFHQSERDGDRIKSLSLHSRDTKPLSRPTQGVSFRPDILDPASLEGHVRIVQPAQGLCSCWLPSADFLHFFENTRSRNKDSGCPYIVDEDQLVVTGGQVLVSRV